MKRSRVGAISAMIATAAMVLAACDSSSTGRDDPSVSSRPPAPSQVTSTAAPTTAADGPTAPGPAPAAGAPVGTVGGSACGAPHGPYTQPTASPTGTVRVGVEHLASSLNDDSGHGTSSTNADVRYLLDGRLFYYDETNTLINNDSFGTCTLDSLDPLTVTYKINKGVMWSDGVPVTAADIVLDWASASGLFNTTEARIDAKGRLKPTDGVAFDAANIGASLITDFPTVHDDGRSVTVTYSRYFADYPTALTVGRPAHIVAMHALGVTNPAHATKELISLLRDTFGKTRHRTADQTARLKAVADFWNTGFDSTAMPNDRSVAISDGAYTLTGWQKGQSMTLTANPDYTWGPRPQVRTIILAAVPDTDTALAELKAGRLDIITPSATTAPTKSLDALRAAGISAAVSAGATYEHLDLVFDNGGPFDPKTYGGNAATARAVRQAFLLSVPRSEILHTLVTPVDPSAVLRQSFTLFPGQAGYDAMIAANGSAAYADAGSDTAIAEAKKLLKKAGITDPVKIRLLRPDDPQRAQEYRLIAASAAKAGLIVIDDGSAQWDSLLADNKAYDAALFAWQTVSDGVARNPPNFLGKCGAHGSWGENNFGHYCSVTVNKAMNDLTSQKDTTKQFDDMMTAEKALWADGFGTPLYQHPNIVGYNSTTVTGVSDAPMSPTFLWNYWDWTVAG